MDGTTYNTPKDMAMRKQVFYKHDLKEHTHTYMYRDMNIHV